MKKNKFWLSLMVTGIFLLAHEARASYLWCHVSTPAAQSSLNGLAGIALPLQTVDLRSADSTSYLDINPEWNNERITPHSSALFRICSASNLTVSGSLRLFTQKGMELLSIDVSLASYFQWFQADLTPQQLQQIGQDGLRVSFVSDQAKEFKIILRAEGAKLLVPHLFLPKGENSQVLFLKNIASLNAVNSYGWQSGCVLDGLAALAQSKTYGSDPVYHQMLMEHLKLCFPEGSVKKLTSIENTPSIAQLAFWDPRHPEIERTLAFWQSRTDSQGGINGSKVVAEGCYTVAWPLAVLARQLNRPDLAQQAILQLRIRRDRLVDSTGCIWLRNSAAGPDQRTYRMWSRGLAWYFLGMAKTMDMLDHPPADLIREFQRTAALMRKYQNKQGLWYLFADDPHTVSESSGSAGIAAAWAIGLRRGWLDSSYSLPLRKAADGIRTYCLTPDGLIKNVAPNNKAQGGERFQRSSPGVMLQFGMGLYAMLLAEIDG